MRNNKGVTLVALVITIIVLLILAGVSLAMLTGDSGILTNAENAKSETAKANAEDVINMTYMDIKTEVYAIDAGASDTVMNSTQMITIAEKYCEEGKATAGEAITGNSDAIVININYTETGLTLATITYDPTPDAPADDELTAKVTLTYAE